MISPAPRIPIWTPPPARRAGPWHPVWRLLAACVSLTARGAKIRAVILHPAPRIQIDTPPSGLLASYAYVHRYGRHEPRCCIAHYRGIPVTWTRAHTQGARP